MFIIFLLKNFLLSFLKTITFYKILTNLNLFKKKVLYFLIYIFINFFCTEIAFCETEDFNNNETENKYIIQKIILICLLSTFLFGAGYFLTDGFTFPNNNNSYILTEEDLERIKKLEEAQRLWASRPTNIEYARICPQVIYNCDIPPGIHRDISVYDYLYGV
jgi:hypothetical protein